MDTDDLKTLKDFFPNDFKNELSNTNFKAIRKIPNTLNW